MDLYQRKLFTTRKFAFTDGGLRIHVKNLTSSEEVEVPFEEINLQRIIRQTKSDYIIIIVGVFFGLVFIINLVAKLLKESDLTWGAIFLMFLFTFLSGLISYINKKRQILIPTFSNSFIELFDDRPSQDKVESFVNDLTLRINDYLKRKYGTIDLDLPIDNQLTNIVYLKERDIISENEFETLKNQLLGKRETNHPIGFKHNRI